MMYPRNWDTLHFFPLSPPYLVWKWKRELRCFTGSILLPFIDCRTALSLKFPKWSRTSGFNLRRIKVMSDTSHDAFWSLDLCCVTRWAIEPEKAPLGDVAHPHNNLVHPSLAVNVWTETKCNIATINLLNQFLPLNKIRLPKRNSRMLRPLIVKKQNHLFRKGKLLITCDWYSFFKFQ